MADKEKYIERLDKVLSHAGFGTRKDVKKILHSGAVSVNGEIVKSADFHVNLSDDRVECDGEILDIKPNIYLMMNKIDNVVCSTKEGNHQTVFDYVDEKYMHSYLGGDLHLVGRLDIDTEGLLLLTSDGNFTHKLISPKTHCSKKYLVYLRDAVDENDRLKYIEAFKKGIHIEAEDSDAAWDCQPAELEWLELPDKISQETTGHFVSLRESKKPCAAAYLTIYEGRYHQVKRMFKAMSNEVVYLKRVAIGEVTLDDKLECGQSRELTKEELEKLF